MRSEKQGVTTVTREPKMLAADNRLFGKWKGKEPSILLPGSTVRKPTDEQTKELNKLVAACSI